MRPRNGAAGRRLRINASGFTTGKRLYAHVVRKRYRRNVFIGKLKGPCRTLKTRARVLLPRRLPPGVYTVQFDTKRRILAQDEGLGALHGDRLADGRRRRPPPFSRG